LLRSDGVLREAGLDDLVQRDGLRGDGVGAGVDLGHVDDVAHHLKQPSTASGDLGGVSVLLCGFVPGLRLQLDQLGETDGGVERRPEFVADIGQEVGLGAARRLGSIFGGAQRRLALLLRSDVAWRFMNWCQPMAQRYTAR
jgi:hypothetical protein